MKCPKCGERTLMTDSRHFTDDEGRDYIRRKRRCLKGHWSHTFEAYPEHSLISDPVRLKPGRPLKGKEKAVWKKPAPKKKEPKPKKPPKKKEPRLVRPSGTVVDGKTWNKKLNADSPAWVHNLLGKI